MKKKKIVTMTTVFFFSTNFNFNWIILRDFINVHCVLKARIGMTVCKTMRDNKRDLDMSIDAFICVRLFRFQLLWNGIFVCIIIRCILSFGYCDLNRFLLNFTSSVQASSIRKVHDVFRFDTVLHKVLRYLYA